MKLTKEEMERFQKLDIKEAIKLYQETKIDFNLLQEHNDFILLEDKWKMAILRLECERRQGKWVE